MGVGEVLRQRKVIMTQPTGSPKKSAPSDFTIIDATSVSFVKRGRKSNLDDNLVQALRTLPIGKAIVLTNLRQNPAASTYSNDKARIASSIRTACRAAAVITFTIRWSADGIPQVVR